MGYRGTVSPEFAYNSFGLALWLGMGANAGVESLLVLMKLLTLCFKEALGKHEIGFPLFERVAAVSGTISGVDQNNRC